MFEKLHRRAPNTKTSYAINAGPLVPLGQKAWRFFVARFVRQVGVDLTGRGEAFKHRDCSLRTKQRALSKVSVALNDPEIPSGQRVKRCPVISGLKL